MRVYLSLLVNVLLVVSAQAVILKDQTAYDQATQTALDEPILGSCKIFYQQPQHNTFILGSAYLFRVQDFSAAELAQLNDRRPIIVTEDEYISNISTKVVGFTAAHFFDTIAIEDYSSICLKFAAKEPLLQSFVAKISHVWVNPTYGNTSKVEKSGNLSTKEDIALFTIEFLPGIMLPHLRLLKLPSSKPDPVAYPVTLYAGGTIYTNDLFIAEDMMKFIQLNGQITFNTEQEIYTICHQTNIYGLLVNGTDSFKIFPLNDTGNIVTHSGDSGGALIHQQTGELLALVKGYNNDEVYHNQTQMSLEFQRIMKMPKSVGKLQALQQALVDYTTIGHEQDLSNGRNIKTLCLKNEAVTYHDLFVPIYHYIEAIKRFQNVIPLTKAIKFNNFIINCMMGKYTH